MSGTTRKGRKALIVGGGIAGPVTAMALGRAGIEAVVYEAHGGGADDAGAFLTLASNGLDALRAIDAHRHVLVEGFPTPRMEIQSGTGKLLGEVPNGGTLPDGTVSQTLKRSDLYRVLRDEALQRGVSIEYGKRLADPEVTPGGGVAASVGDGTVRLEEHTSELQSRPYLVFRLFLVNDTATTEIYTLSLHDALPISQRRDAPRWHGEPDPQAVRPLPGAARRGPPTRGQHRVREAARGRGGHAGRWRRGELRGRHREIGRAHV